MQYILKFVWVGAGVACMALALLATLFTFTAHAYELTVNTAHAATSTDATSTDEEKILGDVTEQEFATLLKSATIATEKSLAKTAVSGSVIAIGPDAKGQSTMLIESANGSTTALSLATNVLIVRDDGTAAAVADLAPDQHVIIAPQDALLSPGTVTSSEGGVLIVTKTDGTDVTVGTSSKALFERDSAPSTANEFTSGDSVVLVEREDTTGSSTVLAVMQPKAPEVQPSSEATTTATTTPEPAQNNMFLWIVIGVAILVLIIGYFLMRRGSSY